MKTKKTFYFLFFLMTGVGSYRFSNWGHFSMIVHLKREKVGENPQDLESGGRQIVSRFFGFPLQKCACRQFPSS